MSRIIRVPYRRIEDFCRQAGIKPYITANVNSRKSLVYLASLRADLIIMTTFHQILRPEVISLPSIATLNVHCSLLPHYRGPDPVHAVLADGVTETGITVHWVDDGVDTGDIVLQERVPVGGARSDGELRPKLARVGAEILLTCIEQARRGELQRRPQVPSDLPRGASKA